MRVLAIIPARGGSKGIKRKNLKCVAGKPLVVHAIDQAKDAKNITDVLVSSEDTEIRDVAINAGAAVMKRIDDFIHDSTVQEVDRLLIWTIKELEKQGQQVDVAVLLYPTAPLRKTETIDNAIDMVVNGGYDSVLSLYEDKTYLWRVNGDTVSPINYDPATRGPRQKESWNQWAENKAVYVMKRDLLVNTGCRLGGKIGYIEMDKLESIDIDTPADLEIVRSIMEKNEDI